MERLTSDRKDSSDSGSVSRCTVSLVDLTTALANWLIDRRLYTAASWGHRHPWRSVVNRCHLIPACPTPLSVVYAHSCHRLPLHISTAAGHSYITSVSTPRITKPSRRNLYRVGSVHLYRCVNRRGNIPVRASNLCPAPPLCLLKHHIQHVRAN